MFDKKYIAGIASFAGAINNVKATDNTNGAFTIVIDNKEYSLEAKKIANVATINDIDKLLKALEGVKKDILDGENKQVPGDITKELYFVKSIQPGEGSTNAEFKMDGNFAITLTAAKTAKIELVPKRECIKFKYTGAKQLTTANEDELLKLIVQGKTLKGVKDDGLLGGDYTNHKLGGVGLTDDTVGNEVGGNVIKLFGNNMCELVIDSDKIQVGKFKTVVCNFAEGVEEKLVKGVNLEKLCDAFKDSDNGLKQTNRNLTTVLTGLNECQVDSTNDKFFKDLNGVSIKKDGSDIANDKVTDENQKDFSGANFVVVDNIKEENINPIFLKKNFTVEFDDEGNNTKKVDDTILKKIKEALNAKFSDTVAITVKDITDEISKVKNKNPNDIIVNTAFTNLNAISFEGVNKAGTALEATDVVNSKDVTVKLKGTVFAKDIVKTEINLTCDLTNVKKGDKVLKGEVKGTISPILNKTLTEVTAIKAIIDALNAALSGKFENDSKKIEAEDINFGSVITGDNITKSGAITIKASFVNKLKDDCFDNKETQPEPSKDSDSKGTNGDGGNQNEGNKDQKGYCGSNKK